MIHFLNNVFLFLLLYRTVELYDMAWKGEIDITKHHIAAAHYGGPIGA